jgi:hypothetical protein
MVGYNKHNGNIRVVAQPALAIIIVTPSLTHTWVWVAAWVDIL